MAEYHCTLITDFGQICQQIAVLMSLIVLELATQPVSASAEKKQEAKQLTAIHHNDI